jgi:hypothetical protein
VGDYTFSPTFEENFLLRFAKQILSNVKGVPDDAEASEEEARDQWIMAAAACRFFGEWQPKDFIDSRWNKGGEGFSFFATSFALLLPKGGMLGPHGGGLVADKCGLPAEAVSFELGGIEVRIQRGGMVGQIVEERACRSDMRDWDPEKCIY